MTPVTGQACRTGYATGPCQHTREKGKGTMRMPRDEHDTDNRRLDYTTV